MATHLVGVLGVGYYYAFLLRQRNRNYMENTLAVMLALFSVGLFARCLYWYFHEPVGLRMFIDSLGPLLPMIYAVFAETLMKRHMTKPMKLYFVTTTIVFWLGALTGNLGPGGFLRIPYIAHLTLFMTFMTAFMRCENVRKGLTQGEISIANTNLATLWISLPFYVVDFLPIQNIVHLKYDMLGALFFTYSTLRVHKSDDKLSTIFKEVGQAMRIAIAATLFVSIVAPQDDPYGYLRMFVMIQCLSLVWIIFDRIRFLTLRSRDYPFLGWLANAPTANLPQFYDELKALKVNEDFLVLQESELDGYHVEKIAEYLSNRKQGIMRKDEAVRLIKQSSSEDAFIIEQILDLLKRHRMDSASLLRTKPTSLYLSQLSQAGQADRVDLEIKILQKFSGMIQ
ncbi:MAG: hypothetical protein JST80_10780 [Bdellovibrionales bacterium]|nr:hypothetical protein [Bdellovibrionales bacterium]